MVCLSRRCPFNFFKGCLPDVKDFVDNNDLGRFNLHERFWFVEDLELKVVQISELEK